MNVVTICFQQLRNIQLFRIELLEMRFKKVGAAIAKDEIEDIPVIDLDGSYA